MTRSAVWTVTVVASMFLGVACGGPGGEGANEPSPGIRVSDARARLMPDMGAVYLTIENPAESPDRLLGVTTEMARAAELHETRNENDVMTMVSRADGVEIPSRGVVRFEPGGLHVMLVEPSIPPELRGIPLVLQFERAGTVEVEASLPEPAEVAP